MAVPRIPITLAEALRPGAQRPASLFEVGAGQAGREFGLDGENLDGGGIGGDP
ncbi:MAG TPA: hypothetical protein VHZ54_18345 [Solirubrobacterales bacterium]|nr:hypothetical protein [Solirubrobacterales bacterium]